MSGLVDVDIGGVVKAGGDLLDNLFTSDEERMNCEYREQKLNAGLAEGQMEINKQEASHRSLFVAGWRPAIGWVGAIGLGYNYLLYPFLQWVWVFAQGMGWIPSELECPPPLTLDQLIPIVMGMLGLGTMRTIEGLTGKKANNMGEAVKLEKEKKKFKWPWQKES